MNISKRKQGILAIICTIAMIVTSITVYNPREVKADTDYSTLTFTKVTEPMDSTYAYCITDNTLIDFGANYILLTKAGEYYRLITSGFLHIGVIHLLLNMYSLYIVGTQVEYFYGKVKYIIIYLFSLIMGSLFTVALSSVNTVSAGASGAIFGLLGSILYFGVKYRGYIGNSLVNQIVPVVVLNLIIGFTTPGIGNAAHIGGLVGGYLISMAVGIGIDKKEQQGSKINGIIISTILTIFMIYIGFIR